MMVVIVVAVVLTHSAVVAEAEVLVQSVETAGQQMVLTSH
jgi:hypothetical protein|tara:strand:+ start:441 stop:560 length:120 start_codon:yes stop_codon:yes gene_type:complete